MSLRRDNSDIPITFLRDCFELDESTGVLTWKRRPLEHFRTEFAWRTFNSGYAGEPAGCLNERGYLRVELTTLSGERRILRAHVVVFAIHHGRWPLVGTDIDHINRLRADNRPANLREATRSQNNANSRGGKQRPLSRSAPRGVSWFPRQKKWRARIGVEGSTRSLGNFENLNDAVQARKEAERRFYGAFALGAVDETVEARVVPVTITHAE